METKKKNKSARFVLAFMLITLVFFTFTAFFLYINKPVNNEGDMHYFVVHPGESFTAVAQNLENEGYIRNHNLLKIFYKVLQEKRSIKAGSYKISSAMNSYTIYHKLINGDQDMITVTIPEGWTLRTIASFLEEKNICTEESFIQAASDKNILNEYSIPGENAEGFLFPDTYHFPANYEAEYILRNFLDNFVRKISEVYPEWKELSIEQLYEKIIMASIVEREYRAKEEAPLIASVFYNRMDSWYPRLESCATVTYIITDIMGEPHPTRLRQNDIEIDHDYNTYQRSGLPPGPISNPGYIALKAAFFPAQTDYIYFVLKDAAGGTHNFSSNYDNFMRDKFEYLRSFRSK